MACLTVLFAALIFSKAEAAPTLQGSTGGANVVSADVLTVNSFSIGRYNRPGEKRDVVVFGLGQALEVGALHRTEGNQGAAVQWNVKWALAQEQILRPGIAIGMEDVGAQEQRTAYVVASKGLPFGLRLHAGVGNGRYHGLFGALEAPLLPQTKLLLEQDGRQWGAGVRVSLGPDFRLDAGHYAGKSYVGGSYTY
ncbi:YjbH domain-containing protein [Anaeromusa acidaminophila]|uniref:YjbH domain-containing protein n=1 Tax=Anaeromusa acidaminophila TaxID=81464 RepID=UPI00146DD8EE|nr:YjbH domain-containing protein [Anaeromusa acidaminophila]